jgi:CheY-like chemotaxis protein/nitrogen-specific signal transduction histidine kinase
MLLCRSIESRERALFAERRRAESAEAAARERARAAEDAHAEKTRLLAAVSHDLRQPIMAASTHLSVLRSKLGKGDLAMAREQLGHVRESVSMLGSTLDQLLTASRYDIGNEPIRIEAVEIGAVLEQLQRTFQPEAERKGLELRVRLPRQRVVVTSDATALWRVLMNLVSNAIKFTESEGRPGRGVVVKARVLGGVCRIDVVDTGLGISGEHMDAVWQPYFQVHNAERNRARGLGLGLFLVKRALDQLPTHELRVRSSPGRGSRFTLLLPGVHLSEPGVVVRHALALGPDALGQLRGAYVLLLEDDREARRAIEDLLDDWGVIHASGASLEELIPEVEASARTPDALVTDFRLPGQLTGAACVQELRRLIGETVPAVIVTGESDLAAVRAVMPPDTALLQKPFEETAFAQPLLEAVARARRAESEQIDR